MADAQWVREWAEEHGLDIGAKTYVPLWDGARPDYEWAPAGLVGAGLRRYTDRDGSHIDWHRQDRRIID